MADEIDELVLKIGVDVDSEKLKKLREEIKDFQDKASKNGIKLGIGTSAQGATVGPSDSIKEILAKSAKSLEEILKLQKKDEVKKGRETDAEKKKKSSLIPLVNDISNLTPAKALGGAVGGGIGALGGNAKFGAELGVTLASVIIDLLKSTFDKATKLVDARLTEDLHFDQLSLQTGKSKESLFQLSQQARIAGTTLDALVGTQQKFTSELLHGIDPIKAQWFALTGINIKDEFLKSGGDTEKLTQSLFQKLDKQLDYLPPAIKANVLGEVGYSAEQQLARRYLYNNQNIQTAKDITNTASANGTVPFKTADQSFDERRRFRGAEGRRGAAERRLATLQPAVEAAIQYAEFKASFVDIIADTVNIVAKGYAHFMGEGQNNPEQKRINELSKGLFPGYASTQSRSNASNAGSINASSQ